jgi:hypothetical protein
MVDVHEVCGDKNVKGYNACVIGVQHGKRKRQMEEEFAGDPSVGRDYGDGYKVGREYAFKMTGSRRRRSKKVRKTRRVKNVNGRK